MEKGSDTKISHKSFVRSVLRPAEWYYDIALHAGHAHRRYYLLPTELSVCMYRYNMRAYATDVTRSMLNAT